MLREDKEKSKKYYFLHKETIIVSEETNTITSHNMMDL